MASTNKTTNYDLSQFVETDRPAWLTDYNGDMRKLDTALKAVSDVANGASGGISSLTDRMTAAEGAITTNANDIDALEARADSLEAQAQSTAGTIANIQTEQTAQNLGIEAATKLGYNIARPYDSASTYAVGDYVLFQNTLYKCVTAVPVGEAFVPAKWLAIKVMDEIRSPISNYTEFNILNETSPTFSVSNMICQTFPAQMNGGITTHNIASPSISSLVVRHVLINDIDIFYFDGNISFNENITLNETSCIYCTAKLVPQLNGDHYYLFDPSINRHLIFGETLSQIGTSPVQTNDNRTTIDRDNNIVFYNECTFVFSRNSASMTIDNFRIRGNLMFHRYY